MSSRYIDAKKLKKVKNAKGRIIYEKIKVPIPVRRVNRRKLEQTKPDLEAFIKANPSKSPSELLKEFRAKEEINKLLMKKSDLSRTLDKIIPPADKATQQAAQQAAQQATQQAEKAREAELKRLTKEFKSILPLLSRRLQLGAVNNTDFSSRTSLSQIIAQMKAHLEPALLKEETDAAAAAAAAAAKTSFKTKPSAVSTGKIYQRGTEKSAFAVNEQFKLIGANYQQLIKDMEDEVGSWKDFFKWISKNYIVYGVQGDTPIFEDVNDDTYTLDEVMDVYKDEMKIPTKAPPASSPAGAAAATSAPSPAFKTPIKTSSSSQPPPTLPPPAPTLPPPISPFKQIPEQELNRMISELDKYNYSIPSGLAPDEFRKHYADKMKEVKLKELEERKKQLILEEQQRRAEESARLQALEEQRQLLRQEQARQEAQRKKQDYQKRAEEARKKAPKKELPVLAPSTPVKNVRQILQEAGVSVAPGATANQVKLIYDQSMKLQDEAKQAEEKAQRDTLAIQSNLLQKQAEEEEKATQEAETNPIATPISTGTNSREIRAIIDKYYDTYASNSFKKAKILPYDLTKFCVEENIKVNEGLTTQGKLTLEFTLSDGTVYGIGNMLTKYRDAQTTLVGQGFQVLGIRHALKHIKKHLGTKAHKQVIGMLKKKLKKI